MSKRRIKGQTSVKPEAQSSSHIDRRSFVGRMGIAAAATVAGATLVSPKPTEAQSSSSVSGNVAAPAGVTNPRILQAFEMRVSEALRDTLVHPALNVTNGDLQRYADKGGTFTKTLPHDAYGRVELNAFATFTTALASGKFSDFEKITVGGTRTLNDPQAGLAFDMEALDNVQFG